MKKPEKIAMEKSRTFFDNERTQMGYRCGFLDGIDYATTEIKEKYEGMERTLERLRKIGFPTFKSCVEYANLLNKLQEENKWLRKKTLKIK